MTKRCNGAKHQDSRKCMNTRTNIVTFLVGTSENIKDKYSVPFRVQYERVSSYVSDVYPMQECKSSVG